MPSSIRKFGSIAYIKAEDGKTSLQPVHAARHQEIGYFQVGLVLGEQVIDWLSSIPRKSLKLGYPPPAYSLPGRDYTLPHPGTTDEQWWDKHIWGGQKVRIGQRRLAVQVLARDAICQICHERPATEVHHASVAGTLEA